MNQQLSKEQKIHKIEAIREKKRRLRDARPLFKPHEEQTRFIKCEKPDKYAFCGNGWGKTATGGNIAMWEADGYNPITKEYYRVPTTIHIVLDHPSKVEEVWLPEMRKWFNIRDKDLAKNGKPHYNEIRRPNGSRIVFLFHEQPELVFESTEFKIIIFDEPPPRKLFIAMKRGQRTKGFVPRIYCLGTPIYQPWLREEIYEPWSTGELPNVECFFGSTEANKENLRDGFIEEYSRYLTEEERQARLHGMFFSSGTLALRHLWDRETHIISKQEFVYNVWNSSNPCVVAIDPHPSKKHHACLLGADRFGRIYYIKEIAAKQVARDFARTLRDWYKNFRVVDIVCDSLGSQEGTGNEGFKTFIEVMNEEGVRARATTYREKSDEDFIDKIRTKLAIPTLPDNFGFYLPELRILEGCSGIVKDIENVQWQRHKGTDMMKDKLEIAMRDFLACVKYGLAAGVTYKKGSNKASYTKNASNKKTSFYGTRRRR